MKEIKLTNGKVALVDDEDFEYLSKFKWCVSAKKYAGRGVTTAGMRETKYMHRSIMNPAPGLVVDHINGDGLDNRKANLRIATVSQNLANRSAQTNSKSGIKGVSWSKQNKKWMVQIKKDMKRIHIGFYPTIEDATRAFEYASKLLFGQFAHCRNGSMDGLEVKGEDDGKSKK